MFLKKGEFCFNLTWQAFYNHVACRHGSSIPTEWWEGEGRFVCSSCGRNYDKTKRLSHSHSCQATKASSLPEPHAETLSEEDSATLVDGTTQLELPSLSTMCSLPLSTCKDIPHRCRQLWGEILTEALLYVLDKLMFLSRRAILHGMARKYIPPSGLMYPPRYNN